MKKSLISILLLLCLVLVGCEGEINTTTASTEKTTVENTDITTTEKASEKTDIATTEKAPENTETIEEPTIESKMLELVNSFNTSSNVQLIFAEQFSPSDKSSSHYRTEFRLGAYSNAIGKSYTYGETVVDIVGRQSWSGSIIIRVYMNAANLDQCVEIVKYVSPIMDPDIDSTEIQKTIDYIKENKEANGYYYAYLGLLLLGNDTKGYEFMLKMGND